MSRWLSFGLVGPSYKRENYVGGQIDFRMVAPSGKRGPETFGRRGTG